MHILTKIFIVLVSLLAVFMVPLVVVYAHNEDNYRARYLDAQAQVQAARDQLSTAQAMHSAKESRLDMEIQELESRSRDVEEARNQALVEVQRLESQLATAESMKAEIRSELAKLASGVQTGSQLTTSLVEELRTLRGDMMAVERQNVELDEALRDVSSQLEVAVAARRALQEELQRVQEERAATMNRLGEYVARYGQLDDREEDVAIGIIPDRTLTTSVLNVRRDDDRVLIEIAAGQRDGIREGWTMTVGRGAQFLGNLRIISVDVNRAVGVVSHESEERGLVDVGDIVQSYAGMD